VIELTHDPIDILSVQEAVTNTDNGAVLLFTGVTRDRFEGKRVLRLEYEAYAPLALEELRNIRDEIISEHSGAHVAIVHRLGVVPAGQCSVVIAVGTPRRVSAYSASRYAIEQLKHRVPIFKKEVYADGSAWKANTSA
jgi:molybdopterin synthase catalytic subunit